MMRHIQAEDGTTTHQFNDYNIPFPNELLLLGFNDEQESKGACAMLRLNGAPDVTPDSESWPIITCWCSEEDRKDRISPGMPRYLARAVRSQQEYNAGMGYVLYSGENVHDLVVRVKAYIAQWRAAVTELIEAGKI